MPFFLSSVSRFPAACPALLAGLCLGLTAVVPCSFAGEQQAPINIEADRMVSREEDNSVLFTGKVIARQGGMTIRTEEMTVYYTNSSPDGQGAAPAGGQSGQLERLVCVKDVKIAQDDWLGTGDRLDYWARERKAILSGNAKAWNGPNMISGEAITYYMGEKRSIVDRDPNRKERVRAVIRPGGNKGGR